MALAAPAGFGGVLNPQRGSIFRFDQLQDRFQAAGVSSIRWERGAVLANQDGQKPQQRPFDGQLIPGVFYLRLNLAAELLRITDATVLDIAGRVGFDNLSYFNRLFKRRYGMTPREYRSK